VPLERQRYVEGKRRARGYQIRLGDKAAEVGQAIQADVKFLMVLSLLCGILPVLERGMRARATMGGRGGGLWGRGG
jgi:hypothetical protein